MAERFAVSRVHHHDTGHRGEGAGVTFATWTREGPIGVERVHLGDGTVTLPVAAGDERTIVDLPEGVKPWVLAVRGSDGDVAPAPTLPRRSPPPVSRCC